MIRILVDNHLFGLFFVPGLGLGLFVGWGSFRGFPLRVWAGVSEGAYDASGVLGSACVSSKLYKFDVCVQICLRGRGFLKCTADRVVRGVGGDEFEPLCYPRDVAVDGDNTLPSGEEEDDVGGLLADSR